MPSSNHEQRITKLESRVGEVEINHGKTLYDLKRYMVRTDLRWRKVIASLDVTEEEVDEALDAE